MPMLPRTLPTRLGADDKLIDLYLFSLTVFQVLNVLGGLAVASELLNGPELTLLPLPVRQVLAAGAMVIGVFAGLWRHDGKSLWTWLWVALRFSRLPRRAIARPALVTLDDRSDNRWYEVRPPLAWDDQPRPRHDTRRVCK
jgi:hypothetical protein